MDSNIKKLLKEFYLIKCKGWVKNTGSGTSSAGTTLEHLFGKQEDALPLPDYLGIELKTKLITSKYEIRLFSAVLDNKPDLMNKLWQLCSGSVQEMVGHVAFMIILMHYNTPILIENMLLKCILIMQKNVLNYYCIITGIRKK